MAITLEKTRKNELKSSSYSVIYNKLAILPPHFAKKVLYQEILNTAGTAEYSWAYVDKVPVLANGALDAAQINRAAIQGTAGNVAYTPTWGNPWGYIDLGEMPGKPFSRGGIFDTTEAKFNMNITQNIEAQNRMTATRMIQENQKHTAQSKSRTTEADQIKYEQEHDTYGVQTTHALKR